MRWRPRRFDEAARRAKAAVAAIELAAMHRVETGHGIVSERYSEGKAGGFSARRTIRR